MTDRKTYSQQREANLERLVEQEITHLRIYALRGALCGISPQSQEKKIDIFIRDLPARVAAEYRRSLVTATDKE